MSDHHIIVPCFLLFFNTLTVNVMYSEKEKDEIQPEDTFSLLGKQEAIDKLYSMSPFSRCGTVLMPLCGASGADGHEGKPDGKSVNKADCKSGGRAGVHGRGSVIGSAAVLLSEGTDFDLVYNPLKHLGYKSVLAVLGELYVKMAVPYGLSVRIGVSSKLDFPQISELWSGMVVAMKEHGITAVSLDLLPSLNGLVISLSALGSVPASLKEPQAPHTMDLICVSDNLGSAYMGLHVLEREKAAFNASAAVLHGRSERPGSHQGAQSDQHTGLPSGSQSGLQPDLKKYEYLLGAYLRPEIRGDIVRAFEEAGFVPSCGYFVRNGLADAVKRLSRDTGLGAKIYVERIPIADKVFDMADEIGMDPLAAALNGGDDFRYLFVIPIGLHDVFRRDFQTFDVIGHLAKPEAGSVIVTPEGAELPLKAQGW